MKEGLIFKDISSIETLPSIKKKVWLQWDANLGPSDWKAEAKAMSYQGLNECNGLDSRVYDMHIKCQV